MEKDMRTPLLSTGPISGAHSKKKYFSRFKKPLVSLPNLVQSQINSFDWLVKEGLKEVFKEFSLIRDYSEKKFQLDFTGFELGMPKYDEY